MLSTCILGRSDHHQDHLQGLQVHHGFWNRSMIYPWEWNRDQWRGRKDEDEEKLSD